MELKTVTIEKPADMNFILGQSHFIKTVEDLYEAIVQTVPGMKFGIAILRVFRPGAGPLRGQRSEAHRNWPRKTPSRCPAATAFIIFMEGGFPVNILNTIKNVPEVCQIFCATANPVEVIVAESQQGRGILGVIDGVKTKGIETDADIKWRKDFLRKIGYKL